jgi:ankyrin repeat protein
MTTAEDLLRVHEAILANDHVAVGAYLNNGGNINIKFPKRGYTALHLAAQEGHLDIVKLLLEKGADPNLLTSRSQRRTTPLNLCPAHATYRTDCAGRSQRRTTPLNLCTIKNRIDVARMLLDAKADPNIGNKYGWTALHNVSDRSYLEFMKMLLDSGANIEARNERGCTPLHCAALKCNIPGVRLLLERGANVNARAKFGATPLRFASEFGTNHGNSIELERILREQGGISDPTHVAFRKGLQVAVRLLVLLSPLAIAYFFGLTSPLWIISFSCYVAVVLFIVFEVLPDMESRSHP